MTTNEIFFGLITLAVLVTAGYLIYVLAELRRLIGSTREALLNAEKEIHPTVAGAQESLESVRRVTDSVRRITDNVGIMTDDVKVLTSSLRDAATNVQKATRFTKYIALPPSIEAEALKTGIRAGIAYLTRHFWQSTKKT